MLPVIALVGRPNVGKSTLFNRLTNSRDALVCDAPGLTRDRKYGRGQFEECPFIVIDTGGLSSFDSGVDLLMAEQSWAGVAEADCVMFLVDGRAELTPEDEFIANRLRKLKKEIILVVNKTDGIDESVALSDFYSLGFDKTYPIAASHGRGVGKLLSNVLAAFKEEAAPDLAEDEGEAGIKLAVIGRPNVGKSTLINRIIGESRLVTMDLPGTTRDSISVPFETRGGDRFTLIDTAGIRRKGKVNETIEKFSIVKALQSLNDANVGVLVIDAAEGLTDQDLHLLGFVIDAGKAAIIAVNKWDGLSESQKEQVRESLNRRLAFADFIPVLNISALHGTNVGYVLPKVKKVYECSLKRISTSELNKAFKELVDKHPPPLSSSKRRIKLRYAHMGGHNPPLIIIHGNQTSALPESYKRYLTKAFRAIFAFEGTPIRLQFKDSDNPYKDKKNVLTPGQLRRRKRIKKLFKKKK
jgi:GTP-binding protein